MNSFTLSSNRLHSRNAASLPKTRPGVSRHGIRSLFTLALALLALTGTAEVANAQCDPGLARNCCQNAPGTDCTTNADCGGSLCQPCLYSNGDPNCELASSNPACSLDPASACVTDAECNFGTCEVEACTVNSDCVAGATCNTGTCSQNSCSGNGVVGCVNNADCVDTCQQGDCASCPSAGCECSSGSNCYYAFTCCKFNDQTVGTSTPCADGNACTLDGVCDASGNCNAGGLFEPQGSPCGDPSSTPCDLPDSCDAAGTCLTNVIPENGPCEDGVYCNGSDTCDAIGGCSNHAGDPCLGGSECNVVCNEGSQNCFDAAATPCGSAADTSCTNPDTCDGSGTCLSNDEVITTPCDDGLFCTVTDECDGAGTCSGTGDPCAGGAVCQTICNETADNCFDPAATPCDDGLFCTDVDQCDGSGTCAGTGDPCAGGAQCQQVCNETADNCFDVAATPCNDGLFCTVTDACDGSGTCAGTGDPCAGGAACQQICNEGANNCFDPAATPCGSSSVTDCDLADTCDGSGTCDTNYVAAATACGDGSDTDCTNPDTCDGSGTCDPNNEPAATVCDDGLFCTQTDECDGSGTCAGTGDPCTGGGTCNQLCDDTNDNCFDPAGTPCLDSNFCNGPEACDGSGVCAPGTPPSCDDLNDCTADSCDPATSCVHVATGYATLCNFGILVSSNDDDFPAKLTTGKAPTVNSEVCADGANIGPFTSLVSAPGAVPVPVEANIITTRPARFGEFSVKAKAGATTDANVYTDATKVKCQKSTGCFNTPGTKIIDTGLIVPITGGGDIDTTGADPANKILICENVQSLIAADTADLNARADAGSPTDLGKIKVNKGQTYTINATTVGGESFYDAFKVQLGRGAILNFDGGGDPNSVMVLRVDKKVEFGRSTQVNLVNGASLENVLIMAPTSGKCSVGREATGSGQIFCPAAKVQVGRDANWTGTIVAGNKSKIGRDATVVSGRFTGIIP